MRTFIFILLFCTTIMLAACQEKNTTKPTQTTQDEQPTARKNSNDRVEVQGSGEILTLTGEDVRALMNGRFLLTTFMNQTEGIPVPLADQWKLEKAEEDANNLRTYTFSSDDYLLWLKEPGPDDAGILYFAEINGPEGFTYIAEIHIDGSISPAQ